MKRIFRNILKSAAALAAIAGLLQCSHPFEEGMTGSFPVFSLESSSTVRLPASGSQSDLSGEIKISTNVKVTTQVQYQTSGQDSWVTNLKTTMDEGSNTATVTFTASRNTRMAERSATVKITPSNNLNAISVTIIQAAYQPTGKDEIYEGDLYLRTQEDVDNFIYTGVNGRLIIGNCSPNGYMTSFSDPSLRFESSDIYDLSNLYVLEYAEDGILVVSDNGLSGASVLSPVSTPFIEFTDVASYVAESYAENGGVAPDIRITQNSGTFSGLSFIAMARNISSLTMRDNYISSIEGIENAGSLRTLDLADNYDLSNINTLASMKSLTSADLSGLDISQSQINYVTTSNPDLVITAENLLGNTYLTAYAPEDQITTRSAVLQLGFFNINSYDVIENGVVLTDVDTGFDFGSRQVFNDILESGYEHYFEITGLTPDCSYNYWFYAIGSDSSIHLSPVCNFRTLEEVLYSYTFTPDFPAYQNTGETVGAALTSATIGIISEDGSTITADTCPLTATGDNSWTFSHYAGHLHMLFSNIASDNTSIGMSPEPGTEAGAVDFVLTQQGTSGLGQDLLISTGNAEVTGDMTAAHDFIRPAAKVSMSLEILGNYPIENIQSVQASINNCYSSFRISSVSGTVSYDGFVTNTFTGSTWTDQTINVINDAYILPTAEGFENTVSFVLTMTDGSQIPLSGTLGSPFSANNDYTGENAIRLYVDWNMADGTFTIDEIEDVDDEIEF